MLSFGRMTYQLHSSYAADVLFEKPTVIFAAGRLRAWGGGAPCDGIYLEEPKRLSNHAYPSHRGFPRSPIAFTGHVYGISRGSSSLRTMRIVLVPLRLDILETKVFFLFIRPLVVFHRHPSIWVGSSETLDIAASQRIF
jgi:hypothetical protein